MGLQKIKSKITVWSNNSLLSIRSKELKAASQKDICRPMFVAGLFPIAKTWKQPKCLSKDKQISKMWYINAVGYYSALKRKEILTHATKQMYLEDILLSEINQSQKEEYCMITLIWGP